MGSDSDLPVLKAGLDVLTQFGVLWEVDITSAHRTPFKMGEVATQAAARGIKIIIAEREEQPIYLACWQRIRRCLLSVSWSKLRIWMG
jgi:hypothetical protein